jgi:membrane protease YdiL (CAAX protease family)
VSPVRLLLLFAVGALASLIASVFVVGSMHGILGITDTRTGMVATSAVLSLALLALSWRLLRAEGAGLSALGLSPDRTRLRQFGAGAGIGVVVFLGVAVAQSAAVGASWNFRGIDGVRAAAIGLALTFAFVLAEELMFRGVALRHLRALYGDRAAVLLSALLFGGYHLVQSGNWAMGAVFTFLMPTIGGLVFGWAAVRSKGLALPLGLHLGGNWVQASLTGFAPADSAPGSAMQALWHIPVNADDVRLLTAPDLPQHLPFLAALAVTAFLIGRFPTASAASPGAR